MPSFYFVLLVLAAALLAQSAWSLRDGYRFLAYLRRSLSARRPGFHPRAAVMVPVRGVDAGLETNLDAFFAQDYPAYDLIFAVACRADPAYAFVSERALRYKPSGRCGPCAAQVVLAGISSQRGEKVNNLLAALDAVPPQAEILVFADADARPQADWLNSLIAPLADPAVTVSTGFRWYLPGAGAASRLRAAWDASIATLFGEHRGNFAWGGSMAVRARDFERLQVPKRYWSHTVSDDYGLTQAVRDARGWIRFEPKCLLATSGEVTWREFFGWANRQITITRVYARRLWFWGLLSHLLFCSTIAGELVVALAPEAQLRLPAVGVVISILLLGLAKAHVRTQAARLRFPEEFRDSNRASCYWLWWPLVPWMMLLNFIIAGFKRRIEWQGTEYDLISPQELRVLTRRG
jgi:ceramide glucosyltransferase